MKILFAGSAPFSMPVLERLFDENKVCAVLTVPDRRAGRGMKIHSTPTKKFAEVNNLQIFQPERLCGEILSIIKEQDFDVLVCSAYGRIFGPRFLSLFRKGTVNIHPSLLPRYRGAAPIPAAILAGDKTTGITLQKISQKMDCGDILLQSKYQIQEDDTSASMIKTLGAQSADLIMEFLDNFDKYYNNAWAQNDEDSVYCQKIDSGFGYVNWSESATKIHAMSNALSRPYSGVKIIYKGQVLKIWKTKVFSKDSVDDVSKVGKILDVDKEYGLLLQCRRGILGLLELQLLGKTQMSWKDFLQGHSDIMEENFKKYIIL